MGIRVAAHNQNAMDMALYLQDHPRVSKVYYPGLESHPDHALAASQMKGFGGMLSFELEEGLDAAAFQKALQLIKPSMSLAGVESTLLSPTLTSHALLGRRKSETRHCRRTHSFFCWYRREHSFKARYRPGHSSHKLNHI